MSFLSTARVSEPGHADRVVVVASSPTLPAASDALASFVAEHTGPDHPGVQVDQTRALQLEGFRIVAHHDVPLD